MELDKLWEWEGKKLACKIRPENGNPAADTLRETFAELAKVDLHDLLNELKQSKKQKKLVVDQDVEKSFKEILGRSRIVGASKLAIDAIDKYDKAKSETVTQKNLKKVYTILPKSPPRRVLLEIQRERSKPIEERLPSQGEYKSAAEKLEKRLAKQKAARMAANEKAAKDEEALKKLANITENFLQTAADGSRKKIFPKYEGDLFSSSGLYLDGMLYLSRMADSSTRSRRGTANSIETVDEGLTGTASAIATMNNTNANKMIGNSTGANATTSNVGGAANNAAAPGGGGDADNGSGIAGNSNNNNTNATTNNNATSNTASNNKDNNNNDGHPHHHHHLGGGGGSGKGGHNDNNNNNNAHHGKGGGGGSNGNNVTVEEGLGGNNNNNPHGTDLALMGGNSNNSLNSTASTSSTMNNANGSNNYTVKLACVISLCNWSRNPANATRLASEGAVRAIMQLSLEKPYKIVQYCAAAFRFMSDFPVLASSMIDEGSIKTIADMVNLHADDFLAYNLAIALVNITRINGKEAQVVEAAVIFNALVHLITLKPELGTTCVRGLYNLTCIDVQYPSIERVIRSLISLVSLSAAGTVTAKVKHICAAALCNLSDLKPIRTRMVEEGTIGALGALSKGAETRTRRICAVILQNLSSTTPTGRVEMASRNSVTVAYGLSSDQDPIILRCVGLTLSRLASEASNCQRIINENGIAALCNIAVKYPTIPGITQPVAAAFQLLSSNQPHRVTIVKDGSITAIASLLRSSVDMFTLQHSLLALCNFICEPENHTPIFQMGLIATLVAMCSNENDLLKDLCSLAFLNLSRTEDSRKQLVNAGAVAAIIAIAQQNSMVTKKRCAATLCNLSYHAAGMNKMVADGIIPCIVDLVLAKEITTVHYSCAALCRLCSAVENARLILDSGAVPNLVRGAVEGDHITKQFCGAVLSSLSFYEYCRIPLSEFGAIEALKSLATLNNDITKQRCLVAFANLSCEVSVQLKMIKEGVVSIISELANSYQEINYICCAKAICNLACNESTRLTVAKEGGVHALMMISMVQSVDRLTKILCVLGLNNLLDESTVSFMVSEGLVGSVANLSKIMDNTSHHHGGSHGDRGGGGSPHGGSRASSPDHRSRPGTGAADGNNSNNRGGTGAGTGDSHISNLCAKIFNHLTKYPLARKKMVEKASPLHALFRLCDSSVAETRTISMRTCCNLILDESCREAALKFGIIEPLEKGLKSEDHETLTQSIQAIFSVCIDGNYLCEMAKTSLPFTIIELMKNAATATSANPPRGGKVTAAAIASSASLEICAKIIACLAFDKKARIFLQRVAFLDVLCSLVFFMDGQPQLLHTSLQWILAALRYLIEDYPEMQEIIEGTNVMNTVIKAHHMIQAIPSSSSGEDEGNGSINKMTMTMTMVTKGKIYVELIDILRSIVDVDEGVGKLAQAKIIHLLATAVSVVTSPGPGIQEVVQRDGQWVYYHAAVIVYRWATKDQATRILTACVETCTILVKVAILPRTADIVIMALGTYLMDQKARQPFMNLAAAQALSSLSKQSIAENAISNLVLGVYAMSKLSACREFMLVSPVNMDKVLMGYFSMENPKIRANVNRAYKNLNSDINEAIEEGAVATLIAMSLEGRIKNQSSDEFIAPSLIPHSEQKNKPPTCFQDIQGKEEFLSALRWFSKVTVTKGGAAGKGPEPPEPPPIATDSSSQYPNMTEELDGAEFEGRTKMAFAKMQIPPNIRESFLLQDADFITNKEKEDNFAPASTTAAAGMQDSLAGKDANSAGGNHVLTLEAGENVFDNDDNNNAAAAKNGEMSPNGTRQSTSAGRNSPGVRVGGGSFSPAVGGDDGSVPSYEGGAAEGGGSGSKRHRGGSKGTKRESSAGHTLNNNSNKNNTPHQKDRAQQAAKMGLYA